MRYVFSNNIGHQQDAPATCRRRRSTFDARPCCVFLIQCSDGTRQNAPVLELPKNFCTVHCPWSACTQALLPLPWA